MDRKYVAVLLIGVMVLSVAGTMVAVSTYGFFGKVLIDSDIAKEIKVNEEAYKKQIQIQKTIEKWYYYPYNESDIFTGIYYGIGDSVDDPYTYYMTKEQYDDLKFENNMGDVGGIGIQMMQDKDGTKVITKVYPQTPADRAPLKKGDEILKVNDEDVSKMSVEEMAAKIRGKAGTKVKIEVLRGEQSFVYEIVRENNVVKSVYSEKKGNIGYIEISSFTDETGKEFETHLKELQKQNIQGLIIDLRDNPGGSVSAVLNISDQLLSNKTVCYIDYHDEPMQEIISDRKMIDIPYVILVNNRSASASELLAGAVKDNNAGTLIGETTFGKGIIQIIIELKDGSAVKVTTGQYYSPNNHVIQEIGIAPDIEIQNGYDSNGELIKDNQMEKAVEILNKMISEGTLN
ncbi:MAG: S41 family peptidase [Methanimicrococcus sp.]|nr:S41 family peptidase [Methanimicrococcus sp.]